MPAKLRALKMLVSDVTSMKDLVDMMRYEGMRFSDVNSDLTKDAIRFLCRMDCGIVEKDDPDSTSIVLIKDCTRGWTPTIDRWRSYQMTIDIQEDWTKCRSVN